MLREVFKGDAIFYTQKDISEKIPNKFQSYLTYITAKQPEGEYITSLGIIEQFKAEAERRGWKRILVIAVPQHAWRCVRDCRKMCPEIFFERAYLKKERKTWYNRKDPQFWIWSPFIWWFREIILRMLPFPLYKKVMEWLSGKK
jgi:hypothetical protein